MVQAVAHRLGPRPRSHQPGRVAGAGAGRLRQASLPRLAALLHRVRGRWACCRVRRQRRQEARRLPPVPRGERRHRGDAASGRRLHSGSARRRSPRRRAGRPPRRRRVAHAGRRQEPHYGVLRRPRDPPPRHGEPDDRRADRPQRPRRSAPRHLRPLPRPAAARPGTSREPRRLARQARRRVGGRGLHDHPEVLPRGAGRQAPGAVGAAQHRRDRRRGSPQSLRLHRRLRPAHARRAAERLVRRLHRHADRDDRRQHPRCVRRLHQRLRHPERRRGRRHGAHLLREPSRHAEA